MWKKGQLNRDAVAQDAKKLIVALGLESNVPEDTKIIGIETDGIGEGYPLYGEKLSRVISIYRAKDFSDSIIKAEKMLKHY